MGNTLACEGAGSICSAGPETVRTGSVDLQEDLNTDKHHTRLFGVLGDKLVVRRAATLSLKLSLDEPALAKRVDFTLQGANGRVTFAATAGAADSDGVLEVEIPPQAPIGTYSAAVIFGGNSKIDLPKKLVVLFNAWAEADDVYLASEEERNEYVLEDDGAIWYGSHDWNRGRPWYFGQYDAGVLDACLMLLEKFSGDRGDVVLLSRHFSAVVNSSDDYGVLTGNWSGKYDGGVPPTSWTGSVKILQQWAKSGPVKFGQCWVFSGVLTTVCRCMGIPTRGVTCFLSAHDTDCNRAIDKFIDANGEKLDIGGDSIWNFHVWNEAWFRRPDLQEASGWQAIDATPQEKSGGKWQCGPASIVDIKTGTKGALSKYDLDFVLAEVNADVCYYEVGANKERRLLRVDATHVGRSLITKAVGSHRADDLTNHYKHDEGTLAERVAAMGKAIDSTYKPAPSGLFTLSPVGDLVLGKAIDFKLKLSNDADDSWDCRLAIRALSHMGRQLEVMAEQTHKLQAGTFHAHEMTVTVPVSHYMKYAVDVDFPISAVVHCFSSKRDSMWLDEVVSSVQTPEIHIEVPKERPLSSPIKVSWNNPLSTKLTGCVLKVEAGGLIEYSKEIGTLAGHSAFHETLHETVPLLDPASRWKYFANGHAQVTALMWSNELHDITGRADITGLPR